MDVLFAYVPDVLFINNENTPYGILCLHEILKNNGFNSCVVDYNKLLNEKDVSNSSSNMINILQAIAADIIFKTPNIVSFYTMCSNFYACIYVAKCIKEIKHDIRIVMAGPHATSVAKNILETYEFVDYVALGEGENTIIPFIESVLYPKSTLETINGIAYRKDGVIYINWNKKNRVNGNDLPFFDIGQYQKIKTDQFISIEGGRGCPFNCVFCSTQRFWGNVFVVKPISKILREIEYYHKNYGVSKFSIIHDLFTTNKKYIEKFTKSIKQLPYKIQWSCSSRLDVLDETMLREMIESGCTDIYMGIESGSQKIQKLISKDLKLDILEPIVQFIISEGTNCILSFIYGYPFEEEEDLEATLQTIFRIKQLERKVSDKRTVTIQLHRLTFLPETDIAELQYDKLEYEGINTMSYFDENVVIPDEIKELIQNNKRGFLNCYNLKENMSSFRIHLGDFVCFLFDEMYYIYPLTIDKLIEANEFKIHSLLEELFAIEEECFLELCRFHNLYFGSDKELIMCEVFYDLISSLINNNNRYIAVSPVLDKEHLGAMKNYDYKTSIQNDTR